jgi:hypothetical protein
MVDTAIANCVFAVQSAFHSGLGASPGSLASIQQRQHDSQHSFNCRLVADTAKEAVPY